LENPYTDFVVPVVDNELCSYHIAKISKGKFGELSKIQEEVAELVDAHDQGAKVMELVELSDLIGAIEGYLNKYHHGTTLDDLKIMSDITQRAFINGFRK
jgi:hypothetical protein